MRGGPYVVWGPCSDVYHDGRKPSRRIYQACFCGISDRHDRLVARCGTLVGHPPRNKLGEATRQQAERLGLRACRRCFR